MCETVPFGFTSPFRDLLRIFVSHPFAQFSFRKSSEWMGHGASSCVHFFENFPGAYVDKMAGDGGGCGHLGRDEVCAATATLAALEVAVGGGGAAFAGGKNVRVHAEAHRATRLTPLKARVEKYLV